MVSLFIALTWCGPLPALAAPVISGGLTAEIGQQSGYDISVTDTSLSATIGRIIKYVLGLVGTIFLVLTVYAGILWMTAGGNEEKVTKAMDIFKTAIIGLVIVLAAYSITYFIFLAIANSSAGAGNVGR